jgi:hypothetical protein
MNTDLRWKIKYANFDATFFPLFVPYIHDVKTPSIVRSLSLCLSA